MLTIITACALSIWLMPIYTDYKLIDEIISPDPAVRKKATKLLTARAYEYPETLQRIIDAMDDDSDKRFMALRAILLRLDKFYTPDMNQEWMDRLRCMDLEATVGQPAVMPSVNPAVKATVASRRQLVYYMITSGRDNRFIRRGLRAAARDVSPTIRATAAVLATRLGDDEQLKSLLADVSPCVAAAAARDAGLAGRKSLAGPIAKRLYEFVPKSQSLPPLDASAKPAAKEIRQQERFYLREAVSCCAYALARLDAKKYSVVLCKLVAQVADKPLRDRLLAVMIVLNNAQGRTVVMDIIADSQFSGRIPPAMAIEAAAQMKIVSAGPVALDVLGRAARGEEGLLKPQVIASIDLAVALGLPCRGTINKLCSRLWYPDRPILLSRAARLLGVQARAEQPAGNNPSRDDCATTLQAGATYFLSRGEDDEIVTTPFASAAAAMAAWRLAPATEEFQTKTESKDADIEELTVKRTSAFFVRETVAVDQPDTGDIVAWGLGRSGIPEAFKLGEMFLPARGSKHREYNPAARATGAMLMVLAAQTPSQRQVAVERISRRLKREDFVGMGTGYCALLMAGRKEYLSKVLDLLGVDEFPLQRVLTALLVAGDKTALDQMFYNIVMPLDESLGLLTVHGLDDVLAETDPSLPLPCAAGPYDVQMWQMRILRDAYGLQCVGPRR